MSLASAVAPTGDGRIGGNFTAASTPVAVGGSFETPGASGFPTPAAGQIMTARNNSGSNVRIPYARLVPLRGKMDGPSETAQWVEVPGVQTRDGIVGRPLGMEYDGLESGELAWIKGGKDGSGPGYTLGFGVDRPQRLASQFYVENFFRHQFAQKQINLANLKIVTNTANDSSEISMYKQYLGGASVLGSVDLPHLVNSLFRGGAATNLKYADGAGAGARNIRGLGDSEGFSSGLFVLEKGPFLRGKIVDDAAVEMVAPELKKTIVDGSRKHVVPRNLGDRLAFDALYAKMKTMTMFDWTPDGLILSKLESPSGDPLSSTELDARQAQLFNVAIQGPAITKTWTGDAKMAAMPMDKVFVAIVADVSTKISNTAIQGTGTAGDKIKKMWDAYKALREAPGPGTFDTYEAAFEAAADNVPPSQIGDYAAVMERFFDASKRLAQSSTEEREANMRALETANADLRAYKDTPFDKTVEDAFDVAATKLKRGQTGVETCSMTNFRLMRVTSSFLINNSAVRIENEKIAPSSRCGLKLGKNDDTYTGEYILGAWCIGTVLDSAASRSAVGNQIRTAPASMAMNVNVNIEWMSGDDLYRRYMDVDGTVQQRGVVAKAADLPDRMAGLDINSAARKETTSYIPY